MKRLYPFLIAVFALALWAPTSPARALSDKEKDQIFQASETYTATGTVVEVDDDELEIRRPNLPDAEFEIVENRTEILIDGSRASYRDLERGMQVRVTFQLAEDDPIATRIEAKRGKSGGGQKK